MIGTIVSVASLLGPVMRLDYQYRELALAVLRQFRHALHLDISVDTPM
jgi:hypothetical protein